MPDMALCQGTGCPLKDKCYRYRAYPAEHWQPYFTEVPYKDGDCDRFMTIRGWEGHLRTVKEIERKNGKD